MARNTTKYTALSLDNTSDYQPFLQLVEQSGFVIRVFARFAEVLAEASAALATNTPVLIIASVQHGGLALTEAIRKQSATRRVPVVMVDKQGDTRSAIRALQLGVLDYFVTEMNDESVNTRIAWVHDLVSSTDSPATHEPVAAPPKSTGPISFDPGLRAIRKDDMWVSLSPIEWRLFEELLNHRGHVVSFPDLVLRGLNRKVITAVETSLLRLHMSRLRAKLQQNFGRELNIITLRGRGYMLA